MVFLSVDKKEDMQTDKEIVVVIVGTNDFEDYEFFEEKLYEKLEFYFENNYNIIIREQETNRTDKFAIKFSKENGCKIESYPIQWEKLGKIAGLENIKKLLWGNDVKRGADLLLTFQDKWDGDKSKFVVNKLIEEFKSIIDFQNFNPKIYYSFTK